MGRYRWRVGVPFSEGLPQDYWRAAVSVDAAAELLTIQDMRPGSNHLDRMRDRCPSTRTAVGSRGQTLTSGSWTLASAEGPICIQTLQITGEIIDLQGIQHAGQVIECLP